MKFVILWWLIICLIVVEVIVLEFCWNLLWLIKIIFWLFKLFVNNFGVGILNVFNVNWVFVFILFKWYVLVFELFWSCLNFVIIIVDEIVLVFGFLCLKIYVLVIVKYFFCKLYFL